MSRSTAQKTDPELWQTAKDEVTADDKGGRSGKQFSRQPEPIARKTARHRSGGGREELTQAELYAEARRRDLPGRSRMSKAELQRALGG
jgi:hypothetical protein